MRLFTIMQKEYIRVPIGFETLLLKALTELNIEPKLDTPLSPDSSYPYRFTEKDREKTLGREIDPVAVSFLEWVVLGVFVAGIYFLLRPLQKRLEREIFERLRKRDRNGKQARIIDITPMDRTKKDRD
jgi:hypothetical protein